MEVARSARVYKIRTGWTWYHLKCDAHGQDETIVKRDAPPRTWWGDIRPTQPDAFKRAQRHMEREHGLGVRQHH